MVEIKIHLETGVSFLLQALHKCVIIKKIMRGSGSMKILSVGVNIQLAVSNIGTTVNNIPDLDTAIKELKECFFNEDKAPYNLVILGGNISSLPETRDIILISNEEKQQEVYKEMKEASPITNIVFLT